MPQVQCEWCGLSEVDALEGQQLQGCSRYTPLTPLFAPPSVADRSTPAIAKSLCSWTLPLREVLEADPFRDLAKSTAEIDPWNSSGFLGLGFSGFLEECWCLAFSLPLVCLVFCLVYCCWVFLCRCWVGLTSRWIATWGPHPWHPLDNPDAALNSAASVLGTLQQGHQATRTSF